jgi:hypothetical protein
MGNKEPNEKRVLSTHHPSMVCALWMLFHSGPQLQSPTSWSLLGPGVEVLTTYVCVCLSLSLSQSSTAPAALT